MRTPMREVRSFTLMPTARALSVPARTSPAFTAAERRASARPKPASTDDQQPVLRKPLVVFGRKTT